MNTPKTGAACACRPGIERDNCATCEGSGEVIDFAGREYHKVKPEAATIVLITRLGLRVYLAEGGFTERPNLCPRHPSYAAVRKPRSNCPTCLAAYQERRKESE